MLAKFASAQYTAIPDPNFEQWLLDAGIDSEGTLDGQILTSDALSVVEIEITNSDNNIFNFAGIQDFGNLESFTAGFTDCIEINFGALPNLHTILLNINDQLETIDLSGCPQLENLMIESNNILSLDLSSNLQLSNLSCSLNSIQVLDLRLNTLLTRVICNFNSLVSLDLRNGNNTSITSFNSTNNPDLECIFVDDPAYSEANWTNVDATSNFVSNEAECKALSISDFQELQLVIYPNPVSTFFEIDNKNSLELERLELYDMGGKLVKKFNAQMSTFSVFGLKKGIYFLKITHENGIWVEKLVIE
ncbi:T9SS type A sorting domain-containing protein [Gilvibacter sediminis]|uniref:T9SS type A sorting domain-containing protein n=1 Tax=Gilvibacter sediminis TaxID=379071 RepID=UPI00235048F0|nr:T9SS type A sorting domain-containing protein [Gilvibacter sediminis]